MAKPQRKKGNRNRETMQWLSANGNVEVRSGLNLAGPPPSRPSGRPYPELPPSRRCLPRGNVAKLGRPLNLVDDPSNAEDFLAIRPAALRACWRLTAGAVRLFSSVSPSNPVPPVTKAIRFSKR